MTEEQKDMSQEDILKSIKDSLTDEKREEDEEHTSVLSMIRAKLKGEKAEEVKQDIEESEDEDKTGEEASYEPKEQENVFAVNKNYKEEQTSSNSDERDFQLAPDSDELPKEEVIKEGSKIQDELPTLQTNLLNMTVEELTRKLVEPIVKQYIDDNLSDLIEREVAKAIAKENNE